MYKRYYLFLVFFFFSFYCGNAQSEYKQIKQENGITIWVKDYPGSKFKKFKAEKIYTSELGPIVLALMDVENLQDWYDRVAKVTVTDQISDYEANYIVEFDLPWPVADRISGIRAKLVYDEASNVVKINTQYQPGLVKETDLIQAKKVHSEWIITPRNDGTIHVIHSAFMDPEGSIPAWVANAGVEDGPLRTMSALEDILIRYKGQEVDFLKK